jgi:gluconate kinase
LIAARLATRSGHYMPESLLDSQFATLEEPEADEGSLTVPIAQDPAAVVEWAMRALDEKDG